MKRNYYYFSIILSALAIVIFTILAIASKDEVSTAVTTFLAAGIGLGFLIVSILGLKNKSAIKGIILEKIGILFMGFGVIVLVIGFFSIDMILQAVLISIPACAVGAFCFAKGLNVNGKKAGSTKKADNSSNIAQKYSISNYPELDGIIPAEYRGYINQVIADYNALDDKAFWEKYNLHEIWFTAEEFSQEKAEGRLGFIIVNLLVDKNFILQLDWKEEPADYLNDLRSCWEGEEKIVEFDLDNDQRYLAKVPKEVEMESIYEVKIKDFVLNDEWNTYIEKLCSKMPFLRETLRDGASEDEIKAAEEEMGVQFPGKLYPYGC